MHLCNGCLEAASYLWGRHRLSFPSVSCVLWFLCSSSVLSSEYTSSGSMCLLLCVLPALFMVSTDSWITYCPCEWLTTFAYDSWFIVTCWSVFSQLPLCFPGVNNKAGLGSVWDRFMPIDRAVTCQVHCYSFVDHANMFLCLSNVNIWICVEKKDWRCKICEFLYHLDAALANINYVLLKLQIVTYLFFKELFSLKHQLQLQTTPNMCIYLPGLMAFMYLGARFTETRNIKVQGSFIRHILNYTGYNQ